MSCRTTRQLLDRVRAFHHQLGGSYTRAARTADGGRVRDLLEHLGRHEARMEKCLTAYEHLAAKKVLDAWFGFMPDLPGSECFDPLEPTSDMSIADVIWAAVWSADSLIRFFRAMADHTASDDVKALFGSLASMEEEEKHSVTRAALEFTDGYPA